MDNNVAMRVAAEHGTEINEYGGIYISGQSYDYCKKVEVAIAYKSSEAANGGARPQIRALMKECKVSWRFVNKIEKELKKYGRVLKPKEIYQNRKGRVGQGSAADKLSNTFL